LLVMLTNSREPQRFQLPAKPQSQHKKCLHAPAAGNQPVV